MSDGFSSYASSTGSTDREGAGMMQAQQALVDLILSPDGNFIQSVILEETAKLADAALRKGYSNVFSSSPMRFIVSTFKSQYDTVQRLERGLPSPLRPLLTAPISLPYEIIDGFSQLLEMTEEDEVTLTIAQSFYDELQRRVQLMPGPANSAAAAPLAAAAAPPLPSVQQIQDWVRDPNSPLRKALSNPANIQSFIPRFQKIGTRLTAKVLHRAVERLERSGLAVNGRPAALAAVREDGEDGKIGYRVVNSIASNTGALAKAAADLLAKNNA
jgi:hypothetical protein